MATCRLYRLFLTLIQRDGKSSFLFIYLTSPKKPFQVFTPYRILQYHTQLQPCQRKRESLTYQLKRSPSKLQNGKEEVPIRTNRPEHRNTKLYFHAAGKKGEEKTMPATGSSGDTAHEPVPAAPPSTQQPTISRSSTCTSTTTSTRSVDSAVPTLRLPGQVVSASTWGRTWVPLPPRPGIERTRTLLSMESEVARGRMAGGDSGATARADGSGMDWLGWAGVGGRKRGLWCGNGEGRRDDLESDVV